MLTIDGSQGEGGGQIVRSSLAMSMVTGTPVRLENIRAGRRKPGLMRQHLTAVRAAAHICGAELAGDELGASRLSFAPGPVVPGTHRFSVGTAGSATLVLQTVLPALLTADAPSEITVEGGTHNAFAPPFDFIKRVYLPLINRMGPAVEPEMTRPGFYPAGGGQIVARITPCHKLRPLHLTKRGEPQSRRARALSAKLPAHVAQRELKKIRQLLRWNDDELEAVDLKHAVGPGNAVLLELAYENVTELFTGFGKRGRPAEDVAREAVEPCRAYLAHDAVAGEYLTDQLLLPLALAGGGSFTSAGLSLHATTHIDLIHRFLDVEIEVRESTGVHLVKVHPRPAPGEANTRSAPPRA